VRGRETVIIGRGANATEAFFSEHCARSGTPWSSGSASAALGWASLRTVSDE